jgi:hypothetical protein
MKTMRDLLAVLGLSWLLGLFVIGTSSTVGAVLVIVGAAAMGTGGLLGLWLWWQGRRS